MRLAWSYRGRMNRARYFGRILPLSVYGLLFQSLAVNARPTGWSSAIVLGVLGILSAIVCTCLAIRWGVMRLHDIDKSGRYYWLMLVPVVSIVLAVVLLFRKGTAGENRFGKDPLSMTTCQGCGVTYSDFHDACPMCLPKPRDEAYACQACDEVFDYSAILQGQRCPRCKQSLHKIAWMGKAKDSSVVNAFAVNVKSHLETVLRQKPDLREVKTAIEEVQRVATQSGQSLRSST